MPVLIQKFFRRKTLLDEINPSHVRVYFVCPIRYVHGCVVLLFCVWILILDLSNHILHGFFTGLCPNASEVILKEMGKICCSLITTFWLSPIQHKAINLTSSDMNNQYTYISIYSILLHCKGTGSWNPPSWKPRNCQSDIFNIKVLVTGWCKEPGHQQLCHCLNSSIIIWDLDV